MTKFEKILMFALGLIFILIVWLTIIAIYPFKVIDINRPFKVLTPVVKQGGLLQYQVSATKLMPLTGTKKCSLEDGIIYFLPNIDSKLALGDHSEIVGIPIPNSLPEGNYRYHCVVDYEIIFFRKVTTEFYTEPFKVIE